jgi:hypothetical protein
MVQGNHMTTWAQQRKTHGRIDKPKHAKGTARSGVENVQACSPIFLFFPNKNKPLAHQRPEKMAAVKANMQAWNPYLCI